jgi:uncharacterized protein YndB with AHSA1/START domain
MTMQTERDAPVHITAEVEISAGPATVWDTLADIEHWGEWMPGVKRVSSPAALTPGARFNERTGFVTMRSQLIEVDSPRTLARNWSTAILRTKALERWTFDARGDTTLVHTEQRWRGPLPRLLPRPMSKMLSSVTNERLAALKDEAERRERRLHALTTREDVRSALARNSIPDACSARTKELDQRGRA